MPWVFGYGSLLRRESAQKSMNVLDMTVGVLRGYQRYWGVRSTADEPSVVMGVRAHNKSQCTGVFINIPQDSFSTLDERERKYDRVRLQEGEYEADGVQGEVYVYVPKPQWAQTPPEMSVGAEYLITCILGACEQGIEEEFFRETTGWDRCKAGLTQSLEQTD